ASSEVVRAGLESLLATAPTFQVVGSFPIATALARFEDLQPDVVLLDLESLADESLSPAIELGGMVRNSALVILTDDPENFSAADALRSGVRAILPREATSEEIVAAIQASVVGLVVLHPDALHSVLSPIPPGDQPGLESSDQILTPREIEVLRMIAEGLGNKEIAFKLGISDHTVKFHISSIFTKLGASSRTEAVTIGIRGGMIMV
ncbi:MAG: response regulator transcription factor, partial [Pyrinomonadaceae bacterium]|nr:response regulator transcription factor [Pyrinomonadaceae bacterium]